MTNIEIFTPNPYSLTKLKKTNLLLDELNQLTIHHQENCEPYGNILKAQSYKDNAHELEFIPFLPVRLFKMLDLKSIVSSEITKILTSSGTTSQSPSRIFLNKETAALQTKALMTILTSYLGPKRLPMVYIDTSDTIKDRSSFSARGAGLVGLSIMGREHFYLLDQDMNIKWEQFLNYIDKHQGVPMLFFGFTFMVWKYLFLYCKERNINLNLDQSILIHSGGWKKMEELEVTNQSFKKSLDVQLGIKRIINFYGMVEQVGSIFMECEEGVLHTPDFADVIVRDPTSLTPLPHFKEGVIQVLSLLPRSYPGHSLLTEDIGTILGEDDCPCGRKGKYFKIQGRMKMAELRGCSDTHALGR